MALWLLLSTAVLACLVLHHCSANAPRPTNYERPTQVLSLYGSCWEAFSECGHEPEVEDSATPASTCVKVPRLLQYPLVLGGVFEAQLRSAADVPSSSGGSVGDRYYPWVGV